MSLVEKAISRIKAAPGAERAPRIDPASPVEPAAPSSGAAVTRKSVEIDLDALRRAGYLPEEAKDREFADHYRQIKRPLIHKAMTAATPGAGAADRRVIMVTSALPGDGKTFTSINLALSMARERDLSVLLVDADLPKPHVTKIFGLQSQAGLLDALVNDRIPIESAVLATNIKGLFLMSAGTPAEGSTELLSSERMRQIVRELITLNPRRIVLLDSPPLLITNEGRALVALAGQVALVVRSGQTPPQAVLDAVGMLHADQAGGLILNEAHLGVMNRYYGYGQYGYGQYGEADQGSAGVETDVKP